MTKKLLCLLFIFPLVLSFVSCTKPARIDFSELLLRMEKDLSLYELDIEDAFFSEGQWFLFVSAVAQDDILITVKEDENSFLTDVGISAINTGDDKIAEVYVSFCKAACNAFVFDADGAALLEEAGVLESNAVFSDKVSFSEDGRFKVSFFNAEQGSTMLCSIEG